MRFCVLKSDSKRHLAKCEKTVTFGSIKKISLSFAKSCGIMLKVKKIKSELELKGN